jgi:hypothetical protein
MAIATLTELRAAVVNWLDEAFSDAQVDDFIALAEARFNRELRAPQMEGYETATATGERLALPEGFREMTALTLSTTYTPPLQQVSLARLRTLFPFGGPAVPTHYALADEHLVLAPAPGAGGVVVQMHFFKSISPLSASNPTNWLLTRHPDAYLYGAIAQAEYRGWNDARLPLVKAAYDDVIGQIASESITQRMGQMPTVGPPPVWDRY